MKKTKGNSLKLSTALFKGGFIYNPVLTQIIGICPIVAAATRLTDALAISLTLLLVLVVCEIMTSLLLRYVERWLRLAFYTLVSALFICVFEPVAFAFTPDKGAGIGIYLYLLSANALTVIRCEKFACRTTVKNSITDALAAGIGYGAVACSVGAIREFVSYGTLFSADVNARIDGVSLSFFALLLLGFGAAIHKGLILRFYPEEITDTFSMGAVFEKPSLKDPGVFAAKSKGEFDETSDDFIRPRHGEDMEEKEGEK